MTIKILVAEDSPTQAVRLRADLESQGFTVLVAVNGKAALDIAKSQRPDVILSDVLMPDMDGFRLCREVKMDADLRTTPVVLRTVAFVEEEDREFALGLGAHAYIAKELEGEELGSLLRRMTESQPAQHDREVLDDLSFGGKYGERLLRRLVQEAAEVERSNESLRETQQQLQGILDNSPMFIYVKDLEGRYLLTNKHSERVLGLRPDELVGSRDEDLAGSEPATASRAHDRHVVESGAPVNFEESLIRDDGVHTYLSTKFPLKDSEGSIYAICGISVDITERKRLEEQLRRAQKMEGMGRLAGGIAHDFNNLLSVIGNYAHFASEGLDDTDRRKEDIQQIVEAADRGANLVRQLLTFSRDDSVAAEPLQVNAVIKDIKELLQTSAGKSIEIVTNLDPQLRLTTINSGHLEQVLLNLVINARDAMPDGGRITIESSNVDLDRPTEYAGIAVPAGSYVRLSATDTGLGMTTDTLERIFDPFFTTKPEGTGTGLGLATVHGIVEGADGYITVESELDKGTKFTIHLPAAKSSAVSADDGPSDRTETSVRGWTVLVVDDEAPMRQIIHRTLSQQGYEVITAASGEEALELFRRHDDVGLLITDVVMPAVAGTELAERLTELKPELEVIYMSGYRGVDQGQQRSLPGGAPFIQKPFTVDDLLTQVRLILGPAPEAAAPPVR